MVFNLKILIVEDNQYDADLLLHELKKAELNFTHRLVQTQETFLEAIQQFKPDVILSDYSLPSFDGITAFEIKMQHCPDIPFIIISGTIGEENAVELIKKGVTDYSLKDKLFTIGQKIKRALKETEEKTLKKEADEILKSQNQKLLEIAFLQAHQVRRPIASLIGIINLFRFDNPGDPLNSELLLKTKICAEELDKVIGEIVEKTDGIKKFTE